MAKELSPEIKPEIKSALLEELSPEIKAALLKDVTTIHEILIDNPPLFTKIIETSFLIGNGEVWVRTLSDFTYAQYPDPNTVPRGWELMELLDDLGRLIAGAHQLIQEEIKSIEEDKLEEYCDTLRTLVEQEVREIALPFMSDSEDVSLIGDVG